MSIIITYGLCCFVYQHKFKFQDSISSYHVITVRKMINLDSSHGLRYTGLETKYYLWKPKCFRSVHNGQQRHLPNETANKLLCKNYYYVQCSNISLLSTFIAAKCKLQCCIFYLEFTIYIDSRLFRN